jgi:hypothetical protein
MIMIRWNGSRIWPAQGPVAGQPEPASPATVAESGRNVQHLEPQQLRLDDGQVTGQGEQPQPGAGGSDSRLHT